MSKPKVESESAKRDHRINLALLMGVVAMLLWSGISPVERFTWFLEIIPVIIGVVVFSSIYRRYRYTRLSYQVMFVAAIFICIGGHYTYTQVPMGLWAKEAWGLSRNHWDRVGHFMSGVFTALLIREMVLRRSGVRRGRWLFFLVSSTCLALAAMFEFVEWAVAVFIGDGTQAYLAIQGDEWDAHWDMLLAFVGSMLSQLAFASIQDKQLRARGLALSR